MTWPFTRREAGTATELVGRMTSLRASGRGRSVARDQALRNSAVWACLRLRADLISTLPVDIFRTVQGVDVEVAKPPLFTAPGGKYLLWHEWVYSTQFDLDSTGNTVGIIVARDGLGLPALIEPVNIDAVTFIGKGSTVTHVQIDGRKYDYGDIWHEKQFTVAGLGIGLSPIAYAARTLRTALSAQEFAEDWFNNSTMPGGHLKNTAKTLDKAQAALTKENFKASIESGDVWVSGNDWEYSMLSAKAADAQFLETQKATVTDVCRYLGVPGDMVDAESSSGSITYANVTQRNLQLLIMNLGPAIVRREKAFSAGLVPNPRFVKLNTGALLRMDLKSRYDAHKVAIDARIYPPSRALSIENMPPLTEAEKTEFDELGLNRVPQQQGATS